MPFETVPAARFDDAALADLFSRAYEGYFVPVRLDAAAFRGMVSLQDISLEDSPVVLRDGEPVAIAMLAVRGRAGWIGGMGVVAGRRGAGLGRRVMDEALAAARRRGLSRVDLEVLVENLWASRIYEALGFRDTRRLEVLERAPGTAATPAASLTTPLSIEECLAHHQALHVFERPPWQRGRAVLERMKASVVAFGVRHAAGPRCSVVVRPDPKRTLLLDVGRSADDPEAEALETALREVVPRYADSAITLLNLEATDPAAAILRALGFAPSHVQREMSLAL